MEFLFGTLCLIALVVCYFFLGIFLKFILSWWLLILGLPIAIFFGFKYGLIGSVIALFSFCMLLSLNNTWQDCRFFLFLEKVLDRIFNFSDD
ncbi:hypothetical protein BCS42_11960 [Crenothrix sp. D3]|nr:hypothetical protein BCS42_11960 [Crenothrix sp. D3]